MTDDVSSSNNILSTIPTGEEGVVISKLCGALATDGTIYMQKKMWNGYQAHSYYFELADEWLDNVILVSRWINKICGKCGSINPYKGSFRFRVGNKKLVLYLHGLGFPYGEKCGIVEIPKEILNKGKKYKLSFVSAALMFDGSIKLDGTIEFTTVSKKLRDQMVSILNENNIKVKRFKTRITRWSKNWKYGFYSKSFGFFIEILEGPKKSKLEIIRDSKKVSIEGLLYLFPLRSQAKAPVLKELYEKIKEIYPNYVSFKSLKEHVENKYKVKLHRNTISLYLNLLVRCNIINRKNRRWYVFDR